MNPHVNINDEKGILIFTPGTSQDSGLKPEQRLSKDPNCSLVRVNLSRMKPV